MFQISNESLIFEIDYETIGIIPRVSKCSILIRKFFMKHYVGVIRTISILLVFVFGVSTIYGNQTKWPKSIQDSLISITNKPMSTAQVQEFMYICERQMSDFPKEVSEVLTSIFKNQKQLNNDLKDKLCLMVGQSAYEATDYTMALKYLEMVSMKASQTGKNTYQNQMLFWKSKVFLAQGDIAEALGLSSMLIYDSIHIKDTAFIVKAFILNGDLHFQLGAFNKALGAYRSAQYYCYKMLTMPMAGEVLNKTGVIYFEMGQFDKALDCFLKAIPFLKKQHQFSILAAVKNNIGLVYKALGSYDLALEYLEKSMVYEEEVANLNGLTRSYINIGSLHLIQKSPDQAYKYITRAADLALSIKDSVLISAVFVKLADYYNQKKEYIRARHNASQAIAISTRITDRVGEVEAMYTMGDILKSEKNLSEAQKWYDKALAAANTLNMPEELMRIHYKRAVLFEEQGQFTQAYYNLEKHFRLKDSIAGPHTWMTIANLQAQHKMDEKSSEFEFLSNSYSNQEQQINELSRRVGISDYFRVAFLFVCVLLAGVFILMYYLDKKLSNQRTQAIEARNKLIDTRKLLQESIEKANEADKIKDNFLQTMTHELRTPLNGIIGFSEILYEDLLDADKREIAKTILQSGVRLMSTLNSILDLSDIEARRIELSYSDFSLSKLIESCIARYNHAARQKNLELSPLLKIPDCYIRSDIDIITKVVGNLIDNAIKYTRHGSVTVELDVQHIGEEMNAIIRVKDTGIGIPDERIELVFSRFRQASEGNTRSFEGTGIGLSLTRNLVNLMGGRITVTSKLNQGSVFTVYLPALILDPDLNNGIPQVQSFFLKSTEGQNKIPLLLVEDEETNREFAIYALNQYFDIDLALDGKSALSLVEKKQYEIILLDVNLGKEMTGIDVVKILRKMPSYSKIPIAAVTANALKTQRDAFLKSGFSHYLAKPYTRRELQALVRNMLSGNAFGQDL